MYGHVYQDLHMGDVGLLPIHCPTIKQAYASLPALLFVGKGKPKAGKITITKQTKEDINYLLSIFF